MPFRIPGKRAATPGGKGNFDGFDSLDQVRHWDEVTAGVVLARIAMPPDFRFFTPAEQATAEALLDQLLAQHDEPKVPVAQLVDRRLALGETDGWHYEDLPEDGEAWKQTLAALDQDAGEVGGRRFHELGLDQQAEIVQGVQDSTQWRGFPASRVWSLWTRYACAAFYSHPWAWNEMGFGGPAYPRGYKALGGRERWEAGEVDAQDPVPWAEKVERARRAHRSTTAGVSGHGTSTASTLIGSSANQSTSRPGSTGASTLIEGTQ